MGIVVHIIIHFVSGGIGGLTIGNALPKLSLGTTSNFVLGSVGSFLISLGRDILGIDEVLASDFTVICMFLHALGGAATVAIVSWLRRLFDEE